METPVKPGETGEITARGSNIMKGYCGDPEGTQGVIKDGRLFTGDLATVDDDGYIFIMAGQRTSLNPKVPRISPTRSKSSSPPPSTASAAAWSIPGLRTTSWVRL